MLAIHFLQRQAVILPVSTLFLLEKTQRESASGRRFDRLMNSVPLWMQLLGVLLLAWLLAEPRYQKARSTQRVAIVLDSSASMSVAKDALKTETHRRPARISKARRPRSNSPCSKAPPASPASTPAARSRNSPPRSTPGSRAPA